MEGPQRGCVGLSQAASNLENAIIKPLEYNCAGEYQTDKNLKSFEKNGAKFLFNLYITKGEGKTTEIDVLMLCTKGLFVFESKNYSGWIFGDEDRKNWYQTLLQGKGRSHKESFYNPIMQNRTRIKHLKTLLGEDTPMHSMCSNNSSNTMSENIRA